MGSWHRYKIGEGAKQLCKKEVSRGRQDGGRATNPGSEVEMAPGDDDADTVEQADEGDEGRARRREE